MQDNEAWRSKLKQSMFTLVQLGGADILDAMLLAWEQGPQHLTALMATLTRVSQPPGTIRVGLVPSKL